MSKSKPRGKLSALDLAEGVHLGHAAAALHDLGVLEHLVMTPSTAEELASEFKIDLGMLRGALDFLHARTDLVSKTGTRFAARKTYDAHARFALGLYGGAFGENAAQIQKVLCRPSIAPGLVDGAAHAKTFAAASTTALGGVPELIQQLELDAVLDLGCGTASLLLRLASDDASFVGWGLEPNPSMCKIARARIRGQGVAKRIRLIRGDSRQLGDAVSAAVRKKIAAVSACQVMNEMFGNGKRDAIAWLEQVRETLPDRPMLVSDYYGRLGQKNSAAMRETLLHDYAQLISGQGIPPADLAGWTEVYEAAGCQLIHVLEDRATSRFIHVLVLG